MRLFINQVGPRAGWYSGCSSESASVQSNSVHHPVVVLSLILGLGPQQGQSTFAPEDGAWESGRGPCIFLVYVVNQCSGGLFRLLLEPGWIVTIGDLFSARATGKSDCPSWGHGQGQLLSHHSLKWEQTCQEWGRKAVGALQRLVSEMSMNLGSEWGGKGGGKASKPWCRCFKDTVDIKDSQLTLDSLMALLSPATSLGKSLCLSQSCLMQIWVL